MTILLPDLNSPSSLDILVSPRTKAFPFQVKALQSFFPESDDVAGERKKAFSRLNKGRI